MATDIEIAVKLIAECNDYRISIQLANLKLVTPSNDDPNIIKLIVYYRILSRARQVMNTPVFANTIDENNRRRNVCKEIVTSIDIWLDRVRHIISAPLVMSTNQLMIFYDKYGYTEILNGLKITYNSEFYSDIVPLDAVKSANVMTRYIIRTPEPPLVYNIKQLLTNRELYSTIPPLTEAVLIETDTINLNLKRSYVREVLKKTPEWIENHNVSCFAQLYNNTLNVKIMSNLRRCGIIHNSRLQLMSVSLLNSLDYYKFVDIWLRDGIAEFKIVLRADIKEYLTGSFSSLNSDVKHIKEVLFMNYSSILKLSNDISNMVINEVKSSIHITADAGLEHKQNYMVKIKQIIKNAVNATSLAKPIESMDKYIC